jgi:hypothetical protein
MIKKGKSVRINPTKFIRHMDNMIRLAGKGLPKNHPWIQDVRNSNELLMRRATSGDIALVTGIHNGDYTNLKFKDGFECGVPITLLDEQ